MYFSCFELKNKLGFYAKYTPCASNDMGFICCE